MDRLAGSIEFRRFSFLAATPYAAVALSTLVVLILHTLFHYSSGLEVLYVIPIWLSIRMIGPLRSLFTVVVISLLITLARVHVSNVSVPAMLGGFAIRLLGFSFVSLLIAYFEQSYTKAHGLAYRDPLTGLLNRHGLAEIGRKIFGARDEAAVVVMLDCDGFKGVNDRYGHSAGDHILKMLARILENETRSTDALVRMGGDEFALVLNAANADDARIVLERVQELFERHVADAGYDCSISFGIAEPDGEDELEQVLAKADQAMYASKRTKKGESYLG